MNQNLKHNKKISKITIIICVIAVLLTLFSIIVANNMRDTTEKMYYHPYTVTNSARAMRSRLLDMKQFVSIILTYDFEGEEKAHELFEERYQMQYEAIELIEECYLGDSADVEEIRKAMDNLVASQDDVINYVHEHDNEMILKYIEENVYPKYDELSDKLDVVIDSSDKRIHNLTIMSRHTSFLFIGIAISLVILIVILNIYSNHKEQKVINELVKREKDLQDALLLAQKASNAKKEFLSHMSHEMRTPMNVIIGMTTIAGSHLDDQERLEDCFAKIALSSRHLLAIINDVLDMSKIEEGKLTINHEPFQLPHLIDAVISIVHRQIEEQGKKFECSITNLQTEMFIGDFMRVEQILLNLLSNAIKFTPKEGTIRLDVKQVHAKNNKARLQFIVSDTGIGMSEQFLERIFIPFEQENQMTSIKYGGTGLGMAITHNLVELLGGTIRVKSAINEGTVFTVEIPFDMANNIVEDKNMEMESLKVLIVDDEEDTCIHANLLLQRIGIDADWVNSGIKAVDMIITAHEQNNGFDVCFIDWQMPDMDGIEVTRKVREVVGPETLIIIISAYDWHRIEKEAREAGANAFISKPLFESSIYDVLLSTLNNSAKTSSEEIFTPADIYAGKRFLLVEDNELNQEIAKEFLMQTGATIECANNGQEAVDIFLTSEQGYYDLILMDIQMPIMNGYEATRVIRFSNHEDARSIPILALTANAFKEDVHLAIDAGMNGHISKPIDLKILYKTLKDIL